MTASLFPIDRSCAICHSPAPSSLKRIQPGQRATTSVAVRIYRRSRAGRQVAISRHVCVCEDCLAKASVSGGHYSVEASLLMTALLSQIAETYGEMIERGKGTIPGVRPLREAKTRDHGSLSEGGR